MTLLTVSNQGFTVHNHKCGINFLSHVRGAPHCTHFVWDQVDLGAEFRQIIEPTQAPGTNPEGLSGRLARQVFQIE